MLGGVAQLFLVLLEVTALLSELLILLLEYCVDLLGVRKAFFGQSQLGRVRTVQLLQVEHIMRDGEHKFLSLLYKLLLLINSLLHATNEVLILARHVQERVVHIDLGQQRLHLKRVQRIKWIRRFNFITFMCTIIFLVVHVVTDGGRSPCLAQFRQ